VVRWVCAGIIALAAGFAVKAGWTHVTRSAAGEDEAARPGISVFESRYSAIEAPRVRTRAAPVRVASLGDDFPLEADPAEPVETTNAVPPPSADRFADRFGAAAERQAPESSVVFGGPVWPTRLRGSSEAPVARPAVASPVRLHPASVPLPPEPPGRAIARPAPVQASLEVPAPADPATAAPSDEADHTAIYDITAHAVYLPNGERLEAHSGLGSNLDDPYSVGVKGRGPTPPNIYNLTLRESLFHGVQAIRLTPVGGRKMYGREGLLAHSYMLGPNGQSNGCVSFMDYPKFLNAYLRGDVKRLVVVERLGYAPPGRDGSKWVPGFIRDLFKPSERTADASSRDQLDRAISNQ
jgi:hypothetical protein